jgi:Gly-Xaa carboxypeptidase
LLLFLPLQVSTAIVNYRIDFRSNVQETFAHVVSLIEPIASKLNLTLSTAGNSSLTGSEKDVNTISVTLIDGSALEPAPRTPSEGPAFELVAGTTRAMFEGAIVAPSGMIVSCSILAIFGLPCPS